MLCFSFFIIIGLKRSWRAALVFWHFFFTCRMWKKEVRRLSLTLALRWSRPRGKLSSGPALRTPIWRCKTIALPMRQSQSYEAKSLLRTHGSTSITSWHRICGAARGLLIKSRLAKQKIIKFPTDDPNIQIETCYSFDTFQIDCCTIYSIETIFQFPIWFLVFLLRLRMWLGGGKKPASQPANLRTIHPAAYIQSQSTISYCRLSETRSGCAGCWDVWEILMADLYASNQAELKGRTSAASAQALIEWVVFRYA